ncbi:MAG: hypothetical protein NUW22_13815 [Acidobacteria bacterium]|nr:hypothetical protein [Acidobacteriota bacterium]
MSCTLAEIEQEMARRAGPYQQVTVSSGTASTFVTNDLKSSIDLGGVENLYVLRRGTKSDGTAVAGFTTADRVRTVKAYTASSGTVEVDRDYATSPVADELIELHHLQPSNELRVAAQKGLWRCYTAERWSVVLPGTADERNLTGALGVQTVAITGTPTGGTYTLTYGALVTGALAYNASAATVQAALRLLAGLSEVTVESSGTSPDLTHTVTFEGVSGYPSTLVATSSLSGGSSPAIAVETVGYTPLWITQPEMVYHVEWASPTGLSLPSPSLWWEPFLADGEVWLKLYPETSITTLYVTARRPVATLVKVTGSTLWEGSSDGPTDDDDSVRVDLEYAAASGHLQAWQRFAYRLRGPAAMGLFPDRKEAAIEFTAQADDHFRPPRVQRIAHPTRPLTIQRIGR